MCVSVSSHEIDGEREGDLREIERVSVDNTEERDAPSDGKCETETAENFEIGKYLKYSPKTEVYRQFGSENLGDCSERLLSYSLEMPLSPDDNEKIPLLIFLHALCARSAYYCRVPGVSEKAYFIRDKAHTYVRDRMAVLQIFSPDTHYFCRHPHSESQPQWTRHSKTLCKSLQRQMLALIEHVAFSSTSQPVGLSEIR